VRGRIISSDHLKVPGYDGLYAAGDVAAVPDVAKGGDAICPPTAQHAQRQGKVLADNIVAIMSGTPLKPYIHKDLGLVVDLGGADAVSKPLGIELHGLPAQVVARGYHVMALPTLTARARVVVNWGLNAVAGDDFVRTGFQDNKPKTLQDFEQTKAYLSPDEVKKYSEQLRAGV
jgi:NADH dehydrogenase